MHPRNDTGSVYLAKRTHFNDPPVRFELTQPSSTSSRLSPEIGDTVGGEGFEPSVGKCDYFYPTFAILLASASDRLPVSNRPNRKEIIHHVYLIVSDVLLPMASLKKESKWFYLRLQPKGFAFSQIVNEPGNAPSMWTYRESNPGLMLAKQPYLATIR